MSEPSNRTALLRMLQDQLDAARKHTVSEHERNQAGTIIHVPGIGRRISAAYEQLRNAAEYTEEHLLLQHAIKRFYSRNLSFSAYQAPPDNMGEEMIIELTQASYFRNDSYSSDSAKRLTELTKQYYEAYWALREKRINRDVAGRWILEILSVRAEELLNPHTYITAMAYVEHQHFLGLFPRKSFARTKQEDEHYELCLYIAVHDVLLKSDMALIRADLLKLYRQSPADIDAFIEFNRLVTQLANAPLTQRLGRAVSRYGAPWRIMNTMVAERSDLPELLQDEDKFMDAYNRQMRSTFSSLSTRLDNGLLKSIVFIFITKVLIGVGIEVPYDLLVHDHVAMVPLLVNLFFPPIYMASLKLSLKQPTVNNAKAIRTYIRRTLFTGEPAITGTIRAFPKPRSVWTQSAYTFVFFTPLAIMAVILQQLQFNIVQALIFFTFLSTASFLGFRLSRMVRELELVAHDTNVVTATGDFFYLPFIVIGRWVSSKYSKVNVVAHVLDLGIEMPLKSGLRLSRQWIKFLRERQEEIY